MLRPYTSFILKVINRSIIQGRGAPRPYKILGKTALHILLISRCPPYPLHLGDRLIVWHLVRELTKLGITFDLIALT